MTAGVGDGLKIPQGRFVFDEIRDVKMPTSRISLGAPKGALNGILIRRKNVGKIGKMLFLYIKLLYHYKT